MVKIVDSSRQITSTLVIIGTDYESDALEYTCEARNVINVAVRSVFLTIHGELLTPPPSLPSSLSVCLNDCLINCHNISNFCSHIQHKFLTTRIHHQ